MIPKLNCTNNLIVQLSTKTFPTFRSRSSESFPSCQHVQEISFSKELHNSFFTLRLTHTFFQQTLNCYAEFCFKKEETPLRATNILEIERCYSLLQVVISSCLITWEPKQFVTVFLMDFKTPASFAESQCDKLRIHSAELSSLCSAFYDIQESLSLLASGECISLLWLSCLDPKEVSNW